MIVFLLVVIAVYFGMHYYIYSRAARGLNINGNAALALRLAMLLAGLSFFIGEISSRNNSLVWLKPFEIVGATWMGVLSIAIAVFVLNDILNIFFRTEIFRYYSTLASIFLIFSASAFSLYNSSREPLVKEITVKTSKLPEGTDKFTIAQLSDLHLNFFKSSRWLERVASKTSSLKADLVVITGDLIDADLCRTNGFCQTIKNISSGHGVYAVTGNHEYYSGIERFLEIAKNSDIKVLRNERVDIAGVLELAGIDDKEFGNLSESLSLALKGGPEKSKFTVLLSHQPDIFDKAREAGVDLQLSGHTHAGQVPPMDLIVMLTYKYPFGYYQRGSSYLYTSPGTGIWGPPMRLFSRSEIVKITLSKVN